MAGSLTSLVSELAQRVRTLNLRTAEASSSSSSSRRARRRAQIQKDLESLKITCGFIEDVLEDAESKEFQDKSVKRWLAHLRDIYYDAEDIFDDCDYEVNRLVLEPCELCDSFAYYDSEDSFDDCDYEVNRLVLEPCEVSDSFAGTLTPSLSNEFLEDIANRVRDLKQKFNDINKIKEQLGLAPTSRKRKRVESSTRRPTVPIPQRCFHGREDDKNRLIQKLQSAGEKDKNVSVVALVGVGGIGKTTLAQHVYNSQKIKNYFSNRIWVCVSDDFDITKILTAAIEYLTKKHCQLRELADLQEELRDRLEGKNFLLVLDDVWNENHMLWEELSFIEEFGSPSEESKILVTTRSGSVAQVMRPESTLILNPLSDDDCWNLLQQNAFRSTGNLDDQSPELVAMGREIAKKCRGSPLVAKVIGGLLYDEDDVERWNEILLSKTWEIKDEHGNNDIMETLKLSYANLPFQLKQCFLYCSVYPKDHPFREEELVRLWIAQGLVRTEGRKSLEDVGKERFNGLLQRSFLQSNEHGQFVLHDLMHDLAQYILKERHSLLPKNRNDAAPQTIPDRPYESRTGRTYVSTGDAGIKEYIQNNCVDRTRVLDLRGGLFEDFDISRNMKHLRYLRIDYMAQRGPYSFSNLQNLQTLILILGSEFELLECVCKLKNLRHLRVSARRTGDRTMPSGIGSLTNLRTLDLFGFDDSTLPELKHLKYLQQLSIWLPTAGFTAYDAKEWQLNSLVDLRKLDLFWDDESEFRDPSEEVIDSLQPHTNLTELSIVGYPGMTLPSWLGDPSFTKLTSVNLSKCHRWEVLPGLGGLPRLKSLTISSLSKVKRIGTEFYGSGSASNAFSMLEELEFIDLFSWVEWDEMEGCEFSHLRKLKIHGCHKLERPWIIGKPPRTMEELIVVENSSLLDWCRTHAETTLARINLHLRRSRFEVEDNDNEDVDKDTDNHDEFEEMDAELPKNGDNHDQGGATVVNLDGTMDIGNTEGKMLPTSNYPHVDTNVVCQLVNELLENGNDCEEGVVPVIALVGTKGAGKTEIARSAFTQVKDSFEASAWLPVKLDFDLVTLTKKVVEALPGKSNCELTELDPLQNVLLQKIKGKRFLLVMDDLWNESYEDWDRFQAPLSYGAIGSKILITTWNPRVANVPRVVKVHNIIKFYGDNHDEGALPVVDLDGTNNIGNTESKMIITPNYPHVDTNVISQLVDELLKNGNDCEEGIVPVIALVGTKGVGKTTEIASSASTQVEDRFDVIAKLSVELDFDLVTLTKKVLESLPGMNNCELTELDPLQNVLLQEIKGKKFLLVMDDFWNDNYEDWDRFQVPLSYGATGSKILITTWNPRVADVPRVVKVHTIKS